MSAAADAFETMFSIMRIQREDTLKLSKEVRELKAEVEELKRRLTQS